MRIAGKKNKSTIDNLIIINAITEKQSLQMQKNALTNSV